MSVTWVVRMFSDNLSSGQLFNKTIRAVQDSGLVYQGEVPLSECEKPEFKYPSTEWQILLSKFDLPEERYSALSFLVKPSGRLHKNGTRVEILDLFRDLSEDVRPELMYLDTVEGTGSPRPEEIYEGPENIGHLTYFGEPIVADLETDLSDLPVHSCEAIGDGFLIVPTEDYVGIPGVDLDEIAEMIE